LILQFKITPHPKWKPSLWYPARSEWELLWLNSINELYWRDSKLLYRLISGECPNIKLLHMEYPSEVGSETRSGIRENIS
jgi:hypothetical protein